MHFAIIACSPFFQKCKKNASINQHQATAHHKPHRMSAATLTKNLFYSGVLEICCQVCHTANQLRHLFLDPLQRRSAFGILANSDFSSQNGKKKHANSQGSSISTFLQLFLCLFLKRKKLQPKRHLATPHPPLASITAFPVVLLSAGVGATGCGALGTTCWSFGGASLSGFSSSTGMPIICALDSSPENFCDQPTT